MFIADECLEGLRVIQGILSVVGDENAGKILNVVYPLLLSSGLEIRLAVCDVIDGLAVNDPSLAILVIYLIALQLFFFFWLDFHFSNYFDLCLISVLLIVRRLN